MCVLEDLADFPGVRWTEEAVGVQWTRDDVGCNPKPTNNKIVISKKQICQSKLDESNSVIVLWILWNFFFKKLNATNLGPVSCMKLTGQCFFSILQK